MDGFTKKYFAKSQGHESSDILRRPQKFGPSSTLFLTLLSGVKLKVEDGPNFYCLLRIYELSWPCDSSKYFFGNQSINFEIF